MPFINLDQLKAAVERSEVKAPDVSGLGYAPFNVRMTYVQGCVFAAFVDDGQTDSDERKVLVEIGASCHVDEAAVDECIATIGGLSGLEKKAFLEEMPSIVKAAGFGGQFLTDFERVLTVKSAAKAEGYQLLDDLGRRLMGVEDWRERVRLTKEPSGGVDVGSYVQSFRAIWSGNAQARKFFLAENWRLIVRYCRMAYGWTRDVIVGAYRGVVDWWGSSKIVHLRHKGCSALSLHDDVIFWVFGVIGALGALWGYVLFLISIWNWLWDLSVLQILLFVWALNLIGIALGAFLAGFIGFLPSVGLEWCLCKALIWLIKPPPVTKSGRPSRQKRQLKQS